MGSMWVESEPQMATRHPMPIAASTSLLPTLSPGCPEKPIDHGSVSYKREKWVSRYVNPSLI